jgi:hypothetical protein
LGKTTISKENLSKILTEVFGYTTEAANAFTWEDSKNALIEGWNNYLSPTAQDRITENMEEAVT